MSMNKLIPASVLCLMMIGCGQQTEISRDRTDSQSSVEVSVSLDDLKDEVTSAAEKAQSKIKKEAANLERKVKDGVEEARTALEKPVEKMEASLKAQEKNLQEQVERTTELATQP